MVAPLAVSAYTTVHCSRSRLILEGTDITGYTNRQSFGPNRDGRNFISAPDLSRYYPARMSLWYWAISTFGVNADDTVHRRDVRTTCPRSRVPETVLNSVTSKCRGVIVERFIGRHPIRTVYYVILSRSGGAKLDYPRGGLLSHGNKIF